MPDGSLDPSFGAAGTVNLQQDVFTLVSPNAANIRLLPNGKILAGYFGLIVPDSMETTVVQLYPDGSRDASFGVNGAFTQRDYWGIPANVPIIHDLQVQHNGHIVLVYYSNDAPRNNYGFRLLNASGQILPGYEQVLWANTPNRYEVFVKTLIQPDDKILVAGYLWSYNNNNADKKIVLERFEPDGTVDTSFANHGIAISEITPYPDYLTDAVLQPDGSILACGTDLYNRLFFAKYLSNGAPDSSFGTDGILLREDTAHYYYSSKMQQSADGRLVVTGVKGNLSISQEAYSCLSRFHANGEPDTSFSPDGSAYLPKDGIDRSTVFQDMIMLPDRRMVACGFAADDSSEQLLLVRFLPELNATVWHPDADGDGYGSATDSLFSDQQPQGYVASSGDCDDQNASINPAAIEICGNGIDDNCDGISLNDSIPPVANCIGSIKVYLDSTGVVSIDPQNLDNGSTDECGTLHFSASQTTFDCSNLFINMVTLTVSDDGGNSSTCQAVVKVSDAIAPVAVCAPQVKVLVDNYGHSSLTLADVDQGSYDNCSTANIRVDRTEFNCSDLGIRTVTLTVEDIFGNVSTCETIVKVADETGPTVACDYQSTVSLGDDGTATIQAIQLDDGSYDNCSPTLQYRLDKYTFNCSDLGAPQLVTLTVEDEHFNTNSCQVEMTVADKRPPVAVCLESITIPLDSLGAFILIPEILDAGSFDNCSTNLIFTADKDTFTCADLGNHTVVLTVQDQSGNTNLCLVEVLIIDKIQPTAICQDSMLLVMDGFGQMELAATAVDGGSFDNCTDLSFEVTPSTFTSGNLGFSIATLTVTDLSGNQSSCSTMVEVAEKPLGTHDPAAAWSAKVYPNPSTGLFNLQIDGARACERVEIFNAAGQLVAQKSVSATNAFDLSSQPAGYYLLRVQADGAVRMLKLSLLH